MKKFNLLLLFLCIGIVSYSQLTVSASTVQNVSCYGGSNGSVTATVSSGTTPYTYSWSPSGKTTQTASGLSSATYTVSVHDIHGLTGTASTTVTQPTAPLSITATALYTVVCPAQQDSLFASGSGGTIPYSYSWNAPFGDIIGCNNCARVDLYPDGNTYVVTAINDMNGCTASASVSVAVHPFPYTTISGSINPIVAGHADTLVAHASGATNYAWSNSATTSAIIVTPSSSTTYSVLVHNTYGCSDTATYFIDTNSVGNGTSSSNAIRIIPSTTVTWGSFSTKDSVEWFSFKAADSNNQIISNSAVLGMPVAHVHRLTLYNSSLQTIADESMPDIIGANQIRIDVSHLTIGNTYYVRAARCPAHANMAGCNPNAAGECNPTQRWDFQMCFRTLHVFVPKDSGNEAPSVSQLYYEHRGQIADLNTIPRFDIKAYTNFVSPAVDASDSAISFVYQRHDTIQRVDMVLTGTSVEPSQPVFKMEEDSAAGYLNYFLGYAPNGVTGVDGYSRLVYKNVYPNIDMHIYSNTDGTKIYFVCNPGSGTNPANIELHFKGANSVSVTGSGGLNVVSDIGTLSFSQGYAYLDSVGVIKPESWHANFVAVNSTTVRFNTSSYNTAEPLIIRIDRGHKALNSYPPIQNLDWSTYFGGAGGQNIFNDVCSDASGNVYAAGLTQSYHYPVTVGVFQDSLLGGEDATIAKFSNSIDSDKRVWATLYGGNTGTGAYGIAIDPSTSSYIYITGYTQSTNLPLASRPSSPNNYVQSSLNPPDTGLSQNAFIAMFSNDGKYTYWATYYGADGKEWARHIAVDKNSHVYVVGDGVSAYNSKFPLLKSSNAGSYNDSTYGTSFILEFDASHPLTGILRKWATRIGDTTHERLPTTILYGCTVDAKNNFYVTGYATGGGYTSPASLIFPYTFGSDNAVLTKFNSNNNIDWSTYYGGSGNYYGGDDARAVMVDPSGNVYITGTCVSDSDIAHSKIGIQTKKLGTGYFQRHNGDTIYGNAYIAEFDSVGTLKWGTYFGGTNVLIGQALTMDNYNNLYVTGWNDESNLPLPATNPAGTYNQRTFVNGKFSRNAFLATFSNANTNPDYVWGSYFGNNIGLGLCATQYSGHNWLYMVGELGNGNTPLVFPQGSWQQSSYYVDSVNNFGTSFISQFDINPIIGSAGIPVIDNSAGTMLIYPNPALQATTLQLNLPENEVVQVSILNLLGETVFTATYKGEQGIFQQQIPISSLPTATYIIKAQTKDKVYYNEMIKLQ